jgi:membrane protein DedA with SNARE-associated domain
MVPESACIPIPSEATLLFSGVAVHQGWMSFALAVVAATAGNLVGSLLAYGVGATHAVDRLPGARQIVARWGSQLEKHGSRAVLIARLLPLARTFVALPAGARRVPLAPFMGYTVFGSAIWAAAFITLGTLMANAWAVLGSVLGRGLLVTGIICVAVITHRGGKRRRQTGAEQS